MKLMQRLFKKDRRTISEELIQSIKILKLVPGDIVVLRSQSHFSPETAKLLKDAVRQGLEGRDVKAFLFEDGLDMDVVHSQD